MMYRQGDVFLIPIKSRPKNLVPVEREGGRIILAHGEATGHAHAVLEKDSVLFESGSVRILAVESEAEVVHEEHGTIPLPKGLYKVVRQREANAGAARRVVD